MFVFLSIFWTDDKLHLNSEVQISEFLDRKKDWTPLRAGGLFQMLKLKMLHGLLKTQHEASHSYILAVLSGCT